ncbi:Hypothetical predicted protein [Paramuricea clavata]|uniref:Uncharacterized protein n=1 Tax=Paramuricea clavata TaxID=317549 RepID=A0A6S7HTD7_PARCT|nr:Hypothetical predicted protein [Paramuricea clavata]
MSSPFSVTEVQLALTTAVQLPLQPKVATKGKTSERSKKKRKRPAIDSDGETSQAMACIIAVMNTNKITAKEAVLSYKKELDEEYSYDYVDLISLGRW